MPRTSSLTVLVAILLLSTAVPAEANGILVANEGGRGQAAPRPVSGTPVRLTGHVVKAKVLDAVADVTVEQVFHNSSKRQLEGTYLFPLPEGAVVSRFAMTMGGRMVEGEILEANKARQIYESIVRERRDPGLLEYVGRGLFRARVFPIPPRGEVRVRIGYQQVLSEHEGVLELRYPLASDRFGAMPVQEVSVAFEVESSVDVKGVYSPSHELKIERTGERRVSARLEQRGRRQMRDVRLYIARSAADVACTVLSNKRVGEDGTFMAVVAPRARVSEDERLPRDVTYVVDTSGSMRGEKLTQAKAALRQGIAGLHAGDRFNVISFSGIARPFRDAPVDVGAETRQAAGDWIGRLHADGGTNIGEALAAALRGADADRLKLVVLITDGRPTIGHKSTRHLVDMVKRLNVGGARIFTFGVGFDLDVGLLDRIAENTRGARDYVAPREDIEIVTGRFFRKVDAPALTDVRLELGSGITDVYPRVLPDLFAGEQLVVYGRYREAGKRMIILRGRAGTREIVREHAVTFTDEEAADFLPRLWANRKVAYLLDQIRLSGLEPELVDEVVRLATRYAIVTPYTAGLVVEESELSRVRSENPLFQIGGRTLTPRNAGSHPLTGSVPPGQREPTDPTPPAPPPPTGPAITPPPPSTPTPMTPAPTTPAGPRATAASKDLQKRKRAQGRAASDEVPERVQTVAGKTFVLRKDGRWVDGDWDGKSKTVRVELFSDAYFDLLAKDKRVARYLAVGKRLVVVLDGKAYEIIPAETEK